MRGLNLRKTRGPSEWTWKDLGGSARNWEDLWGGPGRICEGIELQEDEGLSGMDPELTWKGLGGSRRSVGAITEIMTRRSRRRSKGTRRK